MYVGIDTLRMEQLDLWYSNLEFLVKGGSGTPLSRWIL